MTRAVVSAATDIIRSYWSGATKNKEKNNPTKVFQEYCRNEPWAVECKEYEV
jgi:hypothetical protein